MPEAWRFAFAFALSPAFTFNFWDTFGIAFGVALAAPLDDVAPRLAADDLLAATAPCLLAAGFDPTLAAADLPTAVLPTTAFPAAALPGACLAAADAPDAFPVASLGDPDGLFGASGAVFLALPVAAAGRTIRDFLEDEAAFIGSSTLC